MAAPANRPDHADIDIANPLWLEVVAVIADKLVMKPEDIGKITPNAHFIDDLGADSLDTVEVVMGVEEAFSVPVPDELAELIATGGGIYKAIAWQRGLIERPSWVTDKAAAAVEKAKAAA